MEFKILISDKKKTYQKELKDPEAKRLLRMKIGDTFDASLVSKKGKLKITGGSDKDGFPMRWDLPGERRAKLLLSGGVGFNPKRKGERRKKQVRGNVISENIVQINTVLVEKVRKEVRKKVKKVEKKPKAVPKKVGKEKAKKPKKHKVVKKKVGIPITNLRGVGEKKAKELEKASIKTVEDILKADPEEVSSKTSFSLEYLKKLKKSALKR
ncbi:MAG: 30S ribosomal protein S6e [Candidatus Methanofastidiosia archaeon]